MLDTQTGFFGWHLADDLATRAVRVLAQYPTNNPDWEQVAPFPEVNHE